MFAIPTLKDLLERTRQSFRSHLPGSDAWLWPNNVYVSAKVMAGGVYELFGFADYVGKQKFALTADSENLDRHGEEVGLARRPPAPATGVVLLTATGAMTVEAGAVFRRADDVEYHALEAGSILGAGTLQIACVAATDGANTAAEAGITLIVISGVTGSPVAEVGAGGMIGGVDTEDDEAFRARVLFRKRNPPHGGASADYMLWASEIPGVTRVFVERDPPEVRVYPLFDDFRTNGIPTGADLAEVAAHIENFRPATAVVSVLAARPRTINITVAGLSPNSVTVQEAVLAELRATFRRLSVVAGIDIPNPSMPFLAVPSTFSVSWIWQAVANASGELRHQIVTPAADVSLAAGEIPTLGTVTFQAG